MSKKMVSVFLAFVLLISVIPTPAASYAYDKVEWRFLDDNGTLYVKADGELEGDDFYGLSKWDESEVRTVIVGEGTTRLGSGIFCGCRKLQKVVLPESLTHIDGWAFRECTALKEIWIPNSVVRIGYKAFYQCSALEAVHLPSSLREISEEAFAGCTSLKRISFPPNLKTLGKRAFNECSSLKSVTLPEGLTEIGDLAFHCCTNLQRVVLPASLQSLGYRAFFLCEKLRSFTLREGNRNFACIDGALYSPDGKTLLAVPNGHVGKFTIPEGVERVGIFAAAGSPYITEIEIPSSLTTFDIGSFLCCERLCSLVLPKTVMKVLPGAFCLHAIHVKIENPECLIALSSGISVGKEILNGWGYNFGIEAHTKIYGTPGTDAERYADCYDCSFFPLSTWSEPEQPLYDPLPAWTQQELPEPALDMPYNPTNIKYCDVSMLAWYYDEVCFAVKNGLMDGVGDNRFDPEGTMTRAMLVTVLWRYEGRPMGYQNTFTDVKAKEGSWYIDAVAWASANNIVNGIGGSRFDPNGRVTREQMATILFRYAEKKGIDTSKRSNLSVFPDGSSVGNWAKDAIAWAVTEKIINGSDGKLLPQESATRAQVAAILVRFALNSLS